MAGIFISKEDKEAIRQRLQAERGSHWQQVWADLDAYDSKQFRNEQEELEFLRSHPVLVKYVANMRNPSEEVQRVAQAGKQAPRRAQEAMNRQSGYSAKYPDRPPQNRGSARGGTRSSSNYMGLPQSRDDIEQEMTRVAWSPRGQEPTYGDGLQGPPPRPEGWTPPMGPPDHGAADFAAARRRLPTSSGDPYFEEELPELSPWVQRYRQMMGGMGGRPTYEYDTLDSRGRTT